MIGLYRAAGEGNFADVATPSGVGLASKDKLGFGCVFLDADLDGALDLAVANGHIDETVRNIRGNVGYAQPPQLFLNDGKGRFHDVAAELGGGFSQPKVGRGLAYGDFDRDGDLDLLLTTNNGPAYLYRNDQLAGHNSIRVQLVGTKSNRDAIGAAVQVFANGACQSRWVKGGSSYLSQSELPLTFGLGKAGPGRAVGHRLAERCHRGIQESFCRARLSMHRSEGNPPLGRLLGLVATRPRGHRPRGASIPENEPGRQL